METETCVPPGFRFHPTEEELVGYYLQRKINSQKFDLDVIADIDLYKMEPWDIQANCKAGYEEQKEWYFFSHKDKKYPTGTRTNRATAAGFWKATGRDKAVVSKNRLIGMRKTLVFYRGRAPNGSKTDWIMHEYRLQTSQQPALTQEEGWVVCRAFKKPSPNQPQALDHPWQNHSYHLKDHSPSLTSPFSDSMITNHPPNELHFSTFSQPFDHQHDLVMIPNNGTLENQFIDLLPNLDSPTINDEDLWKRNSSIDWKDLDNLISRQSFETESLSRLRSASVSRNCEIHSPSHHMMFGNFPNL